MNNEGEVGSNRRSIFTGKERAEHEGIEEEMERKRTRKTKRGMSTKTQTQNKTKKKMMKKKRKAATDPHTERTRQAGTKGGRD
jgi:hypothetical protein